MSAVSPTQAPPSTRPQPPKTWRSWLVGRPLLDRRRRPPDHRQGRRPRRLRLRRALVHGLRDPGDPDHPGRGRHARPSTTPVPISVAIVRAARHRDRSRTSRPSTPTRAAAAPTSWPATTWASCPRRSPARRCSPTTSSRWPCRSRRAWRRSPRPIPALYDHRVALAITLVIVIMIVNLRGVKESGTIFAIPTYFFIAMMFLTVGIGLCPPCRRAASGSVADPPPPGAGTASAGREPVPAAARLLQRHHRPHRRGGDLQRHHRLQGAAQPQRRHHPDLDVGHPGRAVPGHHLPGRSTSARCRRRRRP